MAHSSIKSDNLNLIMHGVKRAKRDYVSDLAFFPPLTRLLLTAEQQTA